jgi:hypothetical protein
MNVKASIALFTAAAISMAGCGSDTQYAADEERNEAGERAGEEGSREYEVLVPAGTPVMVSLGTELSTETTSEGTTFSGTLFEPIRTNSAAIIPAGSRIRGRVSHIQRPGDGEDAEMTLVLTRIEAGDTHSVETVPLRMEATGATEEGLEKVAAGTVAGGVIGAVIGGKKGAGIGAGVGAGAGTIIAIVTKDDHLRLGEGQKMQFTLSEPVMTESITS